MSRFICIAVWGGALAACALGQTTFATLTGAVTDPNGSVIPLTGSLKSKVVPAATQLPSLAPQVTAPPQLFPEMLHTFPPWGTQVPSVAPQVTDPPQIFPEILHTVPPSSCPGMHVESGDVPAEPIFVHSVWNVTRLATSYVVF